MRPPPAQRQSSPPGFTLVELMVAMVVFMILLGIILAVTNSVSTTMRRTNAGIDALANARTAFDVINRTLSQATLNPYWEYDNPLAPTVYLRQSDLQFIVQANRQNPGYGQEIYFVAPEQYAKDPSLTSTRGLLNACSAFVSFGSSTHFQPGAVSEKKSRYRLMLGLQPTEQLAIFNRPERSAGQTEAAFRTALQSYWASTNWIQNLIPGSPTHVAPLANNVIAFIAWPRLPISEDANGTELTPTGTFSFNSQENALSVPQPVTANQLPPMVQVTIIAISEASAARLDDGSGNPPPLIEGILNGRFTTVANFQSDLEAVTGALSQNHLEFQVFTTSIPLRESKWSRAR